MINNENFSNFKCNLSIDIINLFIRIRLLENYVKHNMYLKSLFMVDFYTIENNQTVNL